MHCSYVRAIPDIIRWWGREALLKKKIKHQHPSIQILIPTTYQTDFCLDPTTHNFQIIGAPHPALRQIKDAPITHQNRSQFPKETIFFFLFIDHTGRQLKKKVPKKICCLLGCLTGRWDFSRRHTCTF